MSRAGSAALILLLGGCGAGTGGWAKPGVEQGAAAQEYRECLSVAQELVRTQTDIDQDIQATRRNDWERAGIARQQSERMRQMTRDRADALVARCMAAKGFAPER